MRRLSLFFIFGALAWAAPASRAWGAGEGMAWDNGNLLGQFRAMGGADGVAIGTFKPKPFVLADPPAPQSEPDYPTAPTPVHCDPGVIEAAQKAWKMARYGQEDYEAGFRVDLLGGRYVVTFATMTYEDMRLHMQIAKGRTVAIFHTHPDISIPEPADKDFKVPVPNYVISRKGLHVTIPGTTRYRFVRRDWMKPCSPD